MVAVALLVVFYFHPPNAQQQPVFIVIVALVVALSFGFIGGTVAVRFSIPLVKDHPVAISAAGGIGAFFATVFVTRLLFPKPGDGGEPPRVPLGPFALHLAPEPVRAEAPVVDFRCGAHAEYLALQPSPQEYVIHEVELPAPGARYQAMFRPVVQDSQIVDHAHLQELDVKTLICFTPSAIAAPNDGRRFASLSCAWGHTCKRSDGDPGLVKTCEEPTGFWDRLIPTANAAPAAVDHWLGASLATLTQRKKDASDDPPFLLLRAQGEPESEQGPLSSVRFYSAELWVNGVPVYVDGWRPDESLAPVRLTPGFEVRFGLQNLGFRGAQDGFEQLELRFTWYDERKQKLGRSAFSRQIVAFRDVPLGEAVDGGIKLRWSGEYQPSQRVDRYSVMVASSKSSASVEVLRERIDAAKQVQPDPDGSSQEIVAVLRPPLEPWRLQQYASPYYSVLIGLRRPNGQIAFSFADEEAARVCRFVYANRKTFNAAVHDTVFRYEWPLGAGRVDAGRDRYKLCSDF